MSSYGRQVLETTGRTLQVIANGAPVDWKTGGVTLDWAKITAQADADVTYNDGRTLEVGKKGLRYGTILAMVRKAEVQTIDLSGADDPNGGTFDITDILGESIEGIAWNVSAADLQVLVRAIDAEFANQITVTKSSFVYTFTFPVELGDVDIMTVDSTDLTTAGSTVTVDVATGTAGDASNGYYAPHDTTATDGRQTLVAGECFILNETVFEEDDISDHPPAFDGGRVWEARLNVGGTGQATLAQVKAAFPRLSYAK